MKGYLESPSGRNPRGAGQTIPSGDVVNMIARVGKQEVENESGR